MVSDRPFAGRIGSGLHAPARFVSAICLTALLMVPVAASGQTRQPAPQRPAAAPAQAPAVTPVPDQLSLLKLLWSTMAAVDQANKTGNYSVLRDLGTPGFQANNNAATLGTVFAALRQQQVDLSDTLIVQPVFEFAPQIVQPGVLRMRGSFNLRPQAIQFDLLYQWRNGWALDAVAVRAVAMNQPAPARR